MVVVVAGRRRVRPAPVLTCGIVDGIMPVVIVRGGDAIETAIVRLQRRVVPRESGIGDTNDNPLSREAPGPNDRRAYLDDIRLDR
jgi:hypothetical protein